MPLTPNKSFPEATVQNKLPANTLPEEEVYYNMSLEGKIRACNIMELNNIYANRELILWKDNIMLTEAFAWPWLKDKLYGSLKEKFKFNIKKFIRKTVVIQEPVLWCLDGYSTGGYFHWITDILPRLWMAKSFLPGIKFAIPDYFFQHWPFAAEFFKLLNVNNFLILQPDKKYLIKTLVLPTRAGNPFYIQPIPLVEGVNWLKETAVKLSSLNLGERIFISRAKARHRRIINEPDLLPVLKKFNFQTVFLEDYSLADQISICHHAKVLLGLHGAGLTNLVFLPEKSKVIEIRPAAVNHMYTCFFTLNPNFKSEYNFVLCQYVTEKFPGEDNIVHRSVILAPEELENRLNIILGN